MCENLLANVVTETFVMRLVANFLPLQRYKTVFLHILLQFIVTQCMKVVPVCEQNKTAQNIVRIQLSNAENW